MKKISRGAIAAIAATVAIGLTLAGCANSKSLSGGGSGGGDGGSITVGSANFPENVALAYVYGQALAADGVKVSYKVNIGARAAYIPALEKGEINLIPEYAGSILSFLDKNANQKSSDDVKTALDSALPKGLTATDFAPAADSDSLNVTPEFAQKNGLKSIADLSKLSSVTLTANPEFETRPDGIPGLKSVYGLTNITFSPINDGGGPATLKALLDGTTQVADIYSTTPSILDNKLVTLDDPKNLFASQQVVPIGTTSKLSHKITALLNKVSAKLTTKDLLEFNKRISGDEKADPKAVASDWLKDNGFSK
ncbi:ABC transporter substrate-binding protein [Pseudolysinimonas kribbensis]|uniref:Amino acid ABC transporter, substrate binding protein n=1 Tax=Pseudolysinimonas kribbensis TaxID=433641 RepID=A0ABQ6KA30_9MICO|nr:ABC transporter substrate-binding protein [Pseudolysinimonas kribbensis]GMA96556.1 putative amino acid ABC transporter, substrate binding protein [Pseudolysinimonas kribbensis]